jgi:uncharacterized protein YjbI with pentapeptide repeats
MECNVKVIKPQSLLFQNAPTQIGNAAMMGFSVGYGFRLSDPRILVHEANVWAAVNAAPSTVPLCQMSMPKKYAEWILAGHSISAPRSESHIGLDWEWAANVRVGSCSKTVSCKSRVSENGFAVLSMDHASAAINPRHIGVQPTGNASLMLMGKLGVAADSAAAMTSIDQRWPERQQWMPKFASTPQTMAEDGTHMGWPQKTDLRLFQQANANQWSSNEVWQADTSYALHGFGQKGESFEGVLPALKPVVMVCDIKDGIQKYQSPETKLQTIWLLPDSDVCVLWWYASIPIAYVLEAPFTYAICAVQSSAGSANEAQLKKVAETRMNYESEEMYLNSDFPLMPSIAEGFVWEQVVGSKDHPNAGPQSKDYQNVKQELLDKHEEILDLDRELKSEIENIKNGVSEERAGDFAVNGWMTGYAASKPVIEGPSWFEYLSCKPVGKVLQSISDQIIKNQDLRGIKIAGWKMNNVVFENCNFDKASIEGCQFDQVEFVSCHLNGVSFYDSIWCKGGLSKGGITGAEWKQIKLEDLSFSGVESINWKFISCHLIGVVFDVGSHVGMIMDDCDGDDLSYHEAPMKDAYWKKVRVSNIGVIKSSFTGWLLTDSALDKFSVVESDFSKSKIYQSTINSFSVVQRSILAGAEISDSTILNGCWIGIDATGINVKNSSLKYMNAEGAKMNGSRWSYCLLTGAHFHKACLAESKWIFSALNEVNMTAAEIVDAEFKDCNMVEANMAWVNQKGVSSLARGGNLLDGTKFFPARG